jgi:hypothetical protein
MVVWPRKF